MFKVWQSFTSRSGHAGDLHRLALLSGLMVSYCAVIYWVYITRVLRFEALGYTYKEPNWIYLAISTLALIAMAFALPTQVERVSTFVLWLLFVLVVVPGAQISLYSSYLSPEMGLIAGLALIGSIGLSRLITWRRKPPQFLGIALSPHFFWILIGTFSLFVYVVVAFTLGLDIRFVNILDVYDIREDYAANLAGSSAILGYLIGTQSNVVNPLIIIRGLMTRNYVLVMLGTLGQALIFSVTGFKTVLFSVPALLLFSLVFFVRSRKERSGFSGTPKANFFMWAPTAMILASVIIDQLTNSIIWTSLFARRFVITPGLMTGIYVDHYSENPFAYLAHSVLSPWIDTQYPYAPAKTIGLWITGSTDTSMNAHLFADGFANFGWAGMVGAAIVLGVYLRLSDRAAAGLPPAVPALLMLMITISLSNTSILTAMFSHGLVAAFVILALAPREGWHPAPDGGLWRRVVSTAKKRAKREPVDTG